MLRWGLGDFVWIYLAGIVASVVGASIGFALTGDTSDHIGAVTTALSTFGQFGTWFFCIAYLARRKGRSLREDFGLTLQLRDWWAPFAGLGLFLIGTALITPLVNIANAHQQVVDVEAAGAARHTRKPTTTRPMITHGIHLGRFPALSGLPPGPPGRGERPGGGSGGRH